MIIATWNVLHHVHALNWGDLPDALGERERNEAIDLRVQELLGSSLAVCLQEVSGDQLQAFQSPHVFSFALPRVPRARQGTSMLADPTEHLVVTSALLPGEVVEQRSFESDPGKGFVAVRFDNGLTVVSVHVSYGARAAAQLDELAAWGRTVVGPVVIGGDYNVGKAEVMKALGAGFTIAALPEGSRPTRPRSAPSTKSLYIDHLVGHGVSATEAGVEDGRCLSDHNPVWSKFA